MAQSISQPSLNLVVIQSPNIDLSAEFYRGVGLSFEKHAHGNGPQHYAADLGGVVFELYPKRAGEVSGATPEIRIGFAVHNVDEVVQRLVSLGGSLLSPVKESPWGRRAVVKDPYGCKVELIQKSELVQNNNPS